LTPPCWIINFIWGIADDVLRMKTSRSKYRDVILSMTMIRRLHAVGVANPEAALRDA